MKNFYKEYTFEVHYNNQYTNLDEQIIIYYDKFEKGYIWQDEHMNEGDVFLTLEQCIINAKECLEEYMNNKKITLKLKE
jgi:hypothetical protein